MNLRSLLTFRGTSPARGAVDAPWNRGDVLTARRLEAMRLEIADLKRQLSAQDTTYNPIRRTGSRWVWATVQAVGTSTFTAKLVDSAGNAIGDTLTVNVAACTAMGVTTSPTLGTELPWIAPGVTLMIEQRTGYRSGWWLGAHNVTTCEGT
jgi:hypothetical protein